MKSTTIRLILVAAVVVAIVGAIGLASANTTDEAPYGENATDHMGSDAITWMEAHMGGDATEWMNEHMSDHGHADYTDHHDDYADHHANHSDQHDEYHDEYHEDGGHC